jgi:hypothetical protein
MLHLVVVVTDFEPIGPNGKLFVLIKMKMHGKMHWQMIDLF